MIYNFDWSFLNVNKFVNKWTNVTTISPVNGNIVALVKNTLEGDISPDGNIYILDLAVLAQCYGTRSGNANFDDAKDLNNDGIVDIYDLVILSKKMT